MRQQLGLAAVPSAWHPIRTGLPTGPAFLCSSAAGYDPKPVPAQFRGTCELKEQAESTA